MSTTTQGFEVAGGFELIGGNRNEHVRAWLRENRIDPPEDILELLLRADSGAEVMLAWEFVKRHASYPARRVGAALYANGIWLNLQLRCGKYLIDLAFDRGFRLAVEVDGLEFHHRRPEQIEGDYVRERAIVRAGYTVIRFTAMEAYKHPTSCLREIEGILGERASR